MARNGVTPTSLLFQQIGNDEALVKELLDKSMRTVKQVLLLDENNTRDIKRLDITPNHTAAIARLLARTVMSSLEVFGDL